MQVSSQQEIRILHVDDDPAFTDLTEPFLKRDDDRFIVETATSAVEGIKKLCDSPPDCVVSDYNMPEMDGIEFLKTVREEYPDLPFILFTGKGSEAVASEAIAADVTDYLQKGSKPEKYELLSNRIRNAVRAQREADRADRKDELMRLTEVAADTGGFELDTETGDVIMTDGTRRILHLPEQANPNFEKNLQHYHPDDRKELRRTVQRALQSGEQTQGIFRYQHPDGEQRLLSITYRPATASGDTTTVRGAIHDITEYRERQEELKSERWFIEQALDTLDDLFYVLNTDGTLRRWNDRLLEITGYTDQDLAGMHASELFPEDERETINNVIGTTLVDGQATIEADLRTADDHRRPYELTGAPLTDTDGNVTGLVGIGRDLTDRRKQERRFQARIEESNDIITIVDADGRHQYLSPSFERILGYDPEEKLGETLWECIHPDDREAVKDTFEEWTTSTDRTDLIEYRFRHADGSWRWIEARGNNRPNDPAVEEFVVTSRDITARKERQQELTRAHDLMSNMEQLAAVGAWEYDPESETLTLTDGVRRVHGLDSGTNLTPEMAFENFHPDDRATVEDRFNTCLETGEPYEMDVRLITPDGQQRWITTRGERVTDGGSDAVVRGYIQDITERQKRERQLCRERQRYTTLFRSLPSPVVHTRAEDGEPVVETVNPAFEETFGYDVEVIRDEPLHEYIVPDDQQDATHQLNQQVLTEGDVQTELQRETTEGVRTFRVNITTRETEADDLKGYVVYTDITDRKQRKQELQELKTQYETLVESFPDGAVFLINAELECVRAGGRELSNIDLSPDDVEGTRPHALYPEEPANKLCHYYEEALDGSANTFEQEYRGELYRVQTVPVRTGDEETNQVMAVSQNITEEAEDKRRLERQNERLEEFTGIVSHDLRSPLAVAKGHLELAKGSPAGEHITKATNAIERGQALIEDLLTLAREGDRVDETDAVVVANVAEECWRTVETAAASLTIEAPETIEADRSRLQQLLENLYRNAVEHGGDNVTVSVDLIANGFVVADTGSGISESDRADIFQAGYSTSENGTGFGLRIVEQVVNAHGWEVMVTESEQGGARFEFTGVQFVE